MATRDITPIVYVTANKIQSALPQRAFTVLLDSGSTHTLINKPSLPFGATPNEGKAKRTTTTMGSFDSSSTVNLQEVKFPQFGNCIIGNVKAYVFDSPACRYDLIVGRDILLAMGINLDFHTKVTKWMGHQIPMKSTTSIQRDLQHVEQYITYYQLEEEEDLLLLSELFTDAIIMDMKYQAVSPQEVVDQLDHSKGVEKKKLKSVFERYTTVFDGTLGCHPTAEIDIELVLEASPIYQRPYPVPFQKRELFNRELNNMIADGVFYKIGESKWGFPSFIIP